MTENRIEKQLPYLVIVSLLLHVAAFALLYLFPPTSPDTLKEAVFIDLQDTTPQLTAPEKSKPEVKRRSEKKIRVASEKAPKGESARDSARTREKSSSSSTSKSQPRVAEPTHPVLEKPRIIAPDSPIASLLKPKGETAAPSQRPNLFPGAGRLARLEEAYRKKFESNIAEGDTRFLNSDDMLFGSFLRRFESAIYGVWRYPQEAAMKGIEGITPVRITFNRNGEITNIRQLESSGAKILDEEVLRTLRAIGPVGGFPKGYTKDEFHLIAFFQYGGSRRSLR